MSTKYYTRIENNLLPLSQADSIEEAIKEWEFNGNTKDHYTTTATCEMCDQQNLRFHFEIVNKLNKNTLQVGSSCIKRYDVSVIGNKGYQIAKKDVAKHLNQFIKKMKYDFCVDSLYKLAKKTNHDILKGALKYLKEHGKLTPKFANVVLWQLKENNIDHKPSYFSVSLRTEKHRDDLKNLKDYQFKLVEPALSSSQKKIAKGLRS